ncbi:MAG: radical SAM family heme chaperone HemW [Caldilineales bacterium]
MPLHDTMPPISLYIHIPFCQRKCPYCDFNTYAGLNRLFVPFTGALVAEIERAGSANGRPAVRTIFLGGGTPTVLPVDLLARIMTACRASFDILPDAEITSEANPGTVDVTRFAALRGLGVNRLSMGVQSFDTDELYFLGRIHSAGEVDAAFAAARQAGFANINLDLIYGLPDQPLATWQRTVQRAVDLGPEHISLYSLTIEEGTPFADWAAAGRIGTPDPDLAADMYEAADEILEDSGYVQYEISNWARGKEGNKGNHGKSDPSFPSFPFFPSLPSTPSPYACRHNLTYWHNEAYLGFGPGAHSSQNGRRWAAIKPVPAYIDRVERGESVLDFVEEIDDRLAMGETMMLGLRLVQEGVAFERFQQRHGQSMLDVFGDEIADLQRLGLLERLPDRVRLTKPARLLGNQVFARFLP